MYVILKLITVGVGGQADKVEMHCITLLCCISIFPLYVYLKTKQKKTHGRKATDQNSSIFGKSCISFMRIEIYNFFCPSTKVDT